MNEQRRDISIKHAIDKDQQRSRVTAKRTIRQIQTLIGEYRTQHDSFPTVRSPFLGAGDSWNAIDGALRRDMLVQCERWLALKAALAQDGLAPSLARLNPAYVRPRTQPRRFADILAMAAWSLERHGRFPLRTDPFDVPQHNDSWTAIDSALIHGVIAACPQWQAHLDKMRRLGATPSLASLGPDYRPVRRQARSIGGILALIQQSMLDNEGKLPTQRSPFPGTAPTDSWRAVCKALRSGVIVQDADSIEFQARLVGLGRKPSLFALEACYADYLQAWYKLAIPEPIRFSAVISQLFWTPDALPAMRDPASSGARLNRALKRSKW